MAYYRGCESIDGEKKGEVTCCAESSDGIRWRKASLKLFGSERHATTNIILSGMNPVCHNFCTFLDVRPGVGSGQRFKALRGKKDSGLIPFVSPTIDGFASIHGPRRGGELVTRAVRFRAGRLKLTCLAV